jgi:hypothetical protein
MLEVVASRQRSARESDQVPSENLSIVFLRSAIFFSRELT